MQTRTAARALDSSLLKRAVEGSCALHLVAVGGLLVAQVAGEARATAWEAQPSAHRFLVGSAVLH